MSTLAIENRFYQNAPESSYLLRREHALEASYALKDSSAEPAVPDVFGTRASMRLGTLPNARMNAEFEHIVRELRISLVETRIDIHGAPDLQIVDADDGSVLIEWHLAGRRLGFNIEPCEGQSGWYFAFSRDSGGQCGSGSLASLDMKALLLLMFPNSGSR